MKRIFIYTVIIGFTIILYACPTMYLHKCEYEYPLNIQNLKDTIKTSDTLWVENDFEPYFCYDNYIFENDNPAAADWVVAEKLMGDTLVLYEPTVIDYTTKIEGEYVGRQIFLQRQGGRYKSKYAIVFPDTGIYSLKIWAGNLKEGLYTAELFTYFNTPSNNIHLLPKKLQEKRYGSLDKPYYYKSPYYIAVVE